MNKKLRRHSGREYTKIYKPDEEPYEEELWNDWNDYRDCFRNGGRDKTLRCKNPKYKLHNKKIKIKAKMRIKKKIKTTL